MNFQGTGTVTFKNLDMFGHTYFGIISNAAKYNLENISYTGAQAIYVQANRTAAIDFYGDIDIKSVDSYVTGIGGSTKSYESQTNGNQAIEADTAVFKAGSNVKMSTVGGHVLQISNSGEGVTLEEGAQVTLEPHMNRNSIEGAPTGTAYALNLQGSKPVNIADGASLNIDLNTVAGDKKLAGAIYISGAGAVNVQDGGRLNVTSNGAWGTGDTSVAIRLAGSGSSINVGKGSTFNFDAQGLGAYTGNIISLGSGASFNANPYSTTTLKADGSGALKLLAVSGGTFTVDQPTLFDVDLTGNSNASARLMNSGSVSVNNSKQHFEDGSYSAPIDTLEIAYTNGNGAVKSVISATQESENKITSEIAGKQKKLTFERAGEALDIVDQSLSLSDDNILTGKVTIDDGLIDTLDVTTDGVPQDVYVNVTVGGRQLTAKVTPNPYWRETGVNYQQLTGADGTFSIDLNEYASALANNATTIAVKATKNFIDDNASVTVGDLRKQNLMYEPAFEESTVTAGESVAVSPTFTKQNTSTPTTPTGAVTYSKADGEEWITVNPNTGEVTANPAADVAPGDYFATVTVTYSDKTVDTVTAKFTVNEVAAPVTKDALNAEIGEEASVKASDAFKNASG
ncbi:YPDG domain-containing protein, partial [Arcanobacterium haemolyticum]|nr:YPDG domain-containing protein [Arcanobacterium haemolyticum]